jgi:hypothetical protein
MRQRFQHPLPLGFPCFADREFLIQGKSLRQIPNGKKMQVQMGSKRLGGG